MSENKYISTEFLNPGDAIIVGKNVRAAKKIRAVFVYRDGFTHKGEVDEGDDRAKRMLGAFMTVFFEREHETKEQYVFVESKRVDEWAKIANMYAEKYAFPMINFPIMGKDDMVDGLRYQSVIIDDPLCAYIRGCGCLICRGLT